MNKNKIISGFSLLVFGILALLNYAGLIQASINEITGIVFILFSLPTVYLSINNNNRIRLVLAVILFLIGIILIVKAHYEIFNTRGIVFISILFINGSVFLILFIENTKEKMFLAVTLVSYLLSYLSVAVFSKLGLFELANKVAGMLEVFWPVILIVIGISIYINRKK